MHLQAEPWVPTRTAKAARQEAVFSSPWTPTPQVGLTLIPLKGFLLGFVSTNGVWMCGF